ncbi:GbsR/MarR family transcriptional regulator [Amycolatopsis sp. NPDC088138]|uniref:GbsR/MarR family transcriptional regulator n=1 Tax=Amycolatopsis sp. NPDC088138 TaxID=3363938 RepID=UPI00381F0457
MTCDDNTVLRYAESLALTLSRIGLRRMPARVLAALVTTHDGRLTAAELAARLSVSPAAVSGAVRDLERIRLVAKEREPGERRVHYRVDGVLWYTILFKRDRMTLRWRDASENGVAALGPDSPAGRRVAEMRDFLSFMLDEVGVMLERWNELREERNA